MIANMSLKGERDGWWFKVREECVDEKARALMGGTLIEFTRITIYISLCNHRTPTFSQLQQ